MEIFDGVSTRKNDTHASNEPARLHFESKIIWMENFCFQIASFLIHSVLKCGTLSMIKAVSVLLIHKNKIAKMIL